MKTATLATIILLALCGTAAAGGWINCDTGVSLTPGVGITKASVNKTICFEPESGDLDSVILDANACDNNDVLYEGDQDAGDGVAQAITVDIRRCLKGVVAVNACPSAGALTGASGAMALEGIGGGWFYVDGDGTIGSENPRVAFHCNASPRP